jgi:hypothetical protein
MQMHEQTGVGSKIRIDNAFTFLKSMVIPDYRDFISQPTDIRRAFHLAASLFHLRDWVQFDYGQLKGWSDVWQLQRFLESKCEDFRLIRDIANASKHLDVSERARTPVTTAAATFATLTPNAIWAPDDLTRRYEGGSEVLVTADHSEPLRFMVIARNVLNMWEQLFEEEGWRIS